MSDFKKANIPLDWFTEQEKLALDRFRQPSHQDMYQLSHGLLKWILSQYCQLPILDLQFNHNAYGKPRLANAHMNPTPRFNLSHSHNYTALAVSVSSPVGIDIELIDDSPSKLSNISRIAKRYFHPNEQAQLASLEGESRIKYFFQLWTLKEAYLKGKGTGIANGLPHCTFRPYLGADIHNIYSGNSLFEVKDTHFVSDDQPTNTQWFCRHISNIDQYSLSIAYQPENKLHLHTPHIQIFNVIPGLDNINVL